MRKLHITDLEIGGVRTLDETFKVLFISAQKENAEAILYNLTDELKDVKAWVQKDLSDKENILKKLEEEKYRLLIFDQTTYEKEKAFEYEEWLESIHSGITKTKLVFIVKELITPQTDVLFFVKKISDPEKMAKKLLKYFPTKYRD